MSRRTEIAGDLAVVQAAQRLVVEDGQAAGDAGGGIGVGEGIGEDEPVPKKDPQSGGEGEDRSEGEQRGAVAPGAHPVTPSAEPEATREWEGQRPGCTRRTPKGEPFRMAPQDTATAG